MLSQESYKMLNQTLEQFHFAFILVKLFLWNTLFMFDYIFTFGYKRVKYILFSEQNGLD